jgi:hypothetical protein
MTSDITEKLLQPWKNIFKGKDHRQERQNLQSALKAFLEHSGEECATVTEDTTGQEDAKEETKEEKIQKRVKFEERVCELELLTIIRYFDKFTPHQIASIPDKDWPHFRHLFLSGDKTPPDKCMDNIKTQVLTGKYHHLGTTFESAFKAALAAEQKRQDYRAKLEKRRALIDKNLTRDLQSISMTCDEEFKPEFEKFRRIITACDKRSREINIELKVKYEKDLKATAAQEEKHIHRKRRTAALRSELNGIVNAIKEKDNVGLEDRLYEALRCLAEFERRVEELYTEPPDQGSAPKSSGS